MKQPLKATEPLMLSLSFRIALNIWKSAVVEKDSIDGCIELIQVKYCLLKRQEKSNYKGIIAMKEQTLLQ